MKLLKWFWNLLFGPSKRQLYMKDQLAIIKSRDLEIDRHISEGKVLREKFTSEMKNEVERIDNERREAEKKHFELLQHCDILEARVLELKRANETTFVSLSVRIGFTFLTSKLVADVIKDLRIKSGLQPSELAAILEISERVYSKIESGKSSITIDQLALISNELQTLPSAIIELAGKLRQDHLNSDSSKLETKSEDC